MNKFAVAFLALTLVLAAPTVHARVFKKLALVAAVVVGAKAMAQKKKDKNQQAVPNKNGNQGNGQ